MDPAAEANLDQIASGYHVDIWMNVRLPAMMKLWKGYPGNSSYFMSEQDAREATGAYGSDPYQFAQTLWQFAQVAPSPTKSYRDVIRQYVVDIDCPAAIGICLGNPHLGSGTVLQYFVPNWERSLMYTNVEFTFANKAY